VTSFTARSPICDARSVRSTVMTIDMTRAYERHVPFPTVFNFRDLGGYRGSGGRIVRWRRVFRADGVHRLTNDELAPFGIRTVVDLRTLGEREERGHFLHDLVVSHHLPMMDSTWEAAGVLPEDDAAEYLAARYLDMLDSGPSAIAGTFRLLANPASLPLVFHCAAGKDRTGVMAALLLSVLGVADDAIAEDYALSTIATTKFVEWLRAERPEAMAEMDKQPTAFLQAPAGAMRAFLEALRAAHGSPETYLAGIGVGPDVLLEVRRNLLIQI
jgi:protein tyrosine/serine phosphatase